jgi:hypothetical protein
MRHWCAVLVPSRDAVFDRLRQGGKPLDQRAGQRLLRPRRHGLVDHQLDADVGGVELVVDEPPDVRLPNRLLDRAPDEHRHRW